MTTAPLPGTTIFGIPRYVLISLFVGIGGVLFGLDTGTISPITTLPTFATTINSSSSPTTHGLLVSAILPPATLSSLLAGPLADAHGRPRTIATGALLFAIGAAIEASAPNLAAFVVGRIITGIGEGLFLSVLVVYVCEIAPAAKRGPLATLPQFGTTLGLALGYFVAYGTAGLTSSASWRAPLALQAGLALVFAVGMAMVPGTPRWLLGQGRVEEAARTAAWLGCPVEELEEGFQSAAEGGGEKGGEEVGQRQGVGAKMRTAGREVGKAFARGVRARTALGCFVMGMQQLAGIDGVLYYAPLLFRRAGLSSEQASFLASGGSALVILVTTVPATWFADHWGRRPSTIYGGLGLTGTMVLIGALYASGSVHAESGAARWVVIAAIYVFASIFSATWAVAFKLYASEIQPAATRASASSLAQSTNWLANFVVALTTPVFLDYSSFGVYFFFGGCSFVTVLVCLVAMPETRGRSLEAIDASFAHHSWFGKQGGCPSPADDHAVASSETNSVVMQSVSPKHDEPLSRNPAMDSETTSVARESVFPKRDEAPSSA